MYKIFIETGFAAAHQLHGYQGACRALHGHTWKVRVEIETNKTDEIGISFDFKSLKEITEKAIAPFDHQHINNVPPFDKENPTAENLSRYLYKKIKTELPDFIRMSSVTLWESANYAISYSEE